MPSLATEPGEVAKAISVFDGASMTANPVDSARKLLANGLLRHASSITMLSRLPALAILVSTCPASTERYITSSSRSMRDETGIR